MAATFFKFDDFMLQLLKGVHHLHAAGDVVKAYLSDAAPSQTLDLVKADIAEIGAGSSNYVVGGIDIQNDAAQTSGTGRVTGVDVTFGPYTGGTVGPFRYVVLYNDTSASDNLIGAFDYASEVTLQIGESLKLDLDPTSVFTIGP